MLDPLRLVLVPPTLWLMGYGYGIDVIGTGGETNVPVPLLVPAPAVAAAAAAVEEDCGGRFDMSAICSGNGTVGGP